MDNNINIRFIQKNNLVKATLLGLFFWILIYFLVPLKVKHGIGFAPFLYLFLNYLFFLFGLKIISPVRKEKRLGFTFDKKVLMKILWIVIFIAFIGFFLKIIDKFYLRGASFAYDISYNRILLEKAGASILSIFSAITTPFSFLPLFVYYTLKSKNKLLFGISIFLFFSPSFDFLMMGSRSGIFVILILFGLIMFYFKKIKITFGRILLVSVLLFFVAIYSTQLFIERTKDFAITDKDAIEHILKRSNYNFTITPTDATKKKIIGSKNKTVQASRLTVINFAQYYLHGVYEFGYLYNNYEKDHHYGAYTFNIFAKFINIVFRTNIDLNKIQKAPVRPGVYTTFYGPIFIDFGWFSLVFMFFFGAFQKTIYNTVLRGRFQFVPLLLYFIIINFFMPVFNFINGALGLYTITSFVLFALIYIFLVGKLRIDKKNGKIQYVKFLK
ncbi:MAG: oligosaccharide repeat unit polymerase [Flavobacteriaceae bacterium]